MRRHVDLSACACGAEHGDEASILTIGKLATAYYLYCALMTRRDFDLVSYNIGEDVEIDRTGPSLRDKTLLTLQTRFQSGLFRAWRWGTRDGVPQENGTETIEAELTVELKTDRS